MNTKYPPMLTPKQSRFVEEYLIDLNGKQAAVRAGYSAKSAEAQASRLLRNTAVQAALGEAMQARSQRTEVTADRVVAELAKLAFADMRDYWPRPGETIDLHRLDEDRTAAISEFTIDETETCPKDGGPTVIKRKTRIKLYDKKAALDSLARNLGMFVDRHEINTFEQRVINMTPAERLQMAAEIIRDGQKYLPILEDAEAKGLVPADDDEQGPVR